MLPPPEMPAHIDKIEVSPSLLPMLFGKLGATIFIQNGDGDFKFSAAMHGTSVSGSFTANSFDIGKIALLKLMTDVSAGAVITGDGSFSLDTEAMTETNAVVNLDLQKIVINAQSIQGFAIPKLTMSKGKVDLEVVHGKGQIKTIQIGRPDSPTDDIKATITADVLFGKTYRTSTGSFKVNFALSPSLLKQFSLLDAILASGKQPDGSFYFRLAGPLTALSPMPPGSGQ
jgi:type II secretion system protein N